MNAKELTNMLNNRSIGNETTEEIEIIAKNNGLVIVFGASDDLIEFRGAINDDAGCYDGGQIPFNQSGLPVNKCYDDNCPYYAKELNSARLIHAIWCVGEYTWSYDTDIPHETFRIMDGEDKYCQGIVFALKDV